MPGTILGAVAKQRIAYCHIKSARYTNSREGLIAIYQAARYALGKGTLMDEVGKALSQRARELGVYNEKGKPNA